MPNVLVVDDEIIIRCLLQDAFVDAGYDVVLAGDGLEAVERLNDSCPELVISDYKMPGLDGLALLAALRAHPNCQDVPFILMSGLAPAAMIALRDQYSQFISKPFVLSKVVEIAQEVLGT